MVNSGNIHPNGPRNQSHPQTPPLYSNNYVYPDQGIDYKHHPASHNTSDCVDHQSTLVYPQTNIPDCAKYKSTPTYHQSNVLSGGELNYPQTQQNQMPYGNLSLSNQPTQINQSQNYCPSSNLNTQTFYNPEFPNTKPNVNDFSQNTQAFSTMTQGVQNLSLNTEIYNQGSLTKNKNHPSPRLSSTALNYHTNKSKELYSMSSSNLFPSDSQARSHLAPHSTGHTPRNGSEIEYDKKPQQDTSYFNDGGASDLQYSENRDSFTSKEENKQFTNYEHPNSDINNTSRPAFDVYNMPRMHRNLKHVAQQAYINSNLQSPPTMSLNLVNSTTTYDYRNNSYKDPHRDPMSTLSSPDLSMSNPSYSLLNQNQIQNQIQNQNQNQIQNQNQTQDFIVNIADIKTSTVPYFPPETDTFTETPDNQYQLPDIDHIACTLNSVFKKKKTLEKLRLPFGVVYSPLKQIKNIPTISPKEVIRCSKCLAYLNPFSVWVEPMTFVCILCSRRKTITSEHLVDLADQMANNISLSSYAQSSMVKIPMKYCSYEILAPPSFSKYPPKTPCHIILMDMTRRSMDTGYLDVLTASIYDRILNLCPNNRSSIAFNVNEVNPTNKSSVKIKHHILSDIDDPYQPFDKELFIFPTKNLEEFKKFLTILPNAVRSMSSIVHDSSCMGTALNFCINALEKSGGRIILFNGSPPTIGEGVTHAPDLVFNNSQESLVGFPIINSTFYKSLSLSASKKSVCIDMFYFGFEKYSPLVNMIPIVYHCGGLFKYFGLFEKSNQAQFIHKFRMDIDNYFTSEYTIDNLVVIRLSRGLEVESYYGNFMLESTGKLSLPFVMQDTTLSFKFEMEDSLNIHNDHIYIQITHFYTNINCERRIHVTTLPIRIVPENNPMLIYQGANQFAIVTLISRFIQLHVSKSKIADVRQASFNACKEIIMHFYDSINTKFDGRNLLMHKNLQHLISLIHSILNSSSLSENIFSAGIDWRINFLEQLKTFSVRNLISRLYPKLYPLQNLEYYPFEDLVGIDPQKSIQPVPPSAQFIYHQFAYLLDTGVNTFILIPREFPAYTLQQIFNCNSFDDLPNCLVGIPVLQNELNVKFRRFVDFAIKRDKSRHSPYFNTIVFKVNANNTCNFFNHLVFDRRPNKLYSLNEFYSHLKEEIIKS